VCHPRQAVSQLAVPYRLRSACSALDSPASFELSWFDTRLLCPMLSQRCQTGVMQQAAFLKQAGSLQSNYVPCKYSLVIRASNSRSERSG
jgi:hypothetical protein